MPSRASHTRVEPRPVDKTGRLWSPGVRIGVRPGSWFHRTECFGPVLGVMRARDLDDALSLQNDTEFGLTAGLRNYFIALLLGLIDDAFFFLLSIIDFIKRLLNRPRRLDV